MVTVTMDRGRVTARGHAADETGCAAVSALLYALAGGLANVCPGLRWRIDKGAAEIPTPDTPEAQAMRLMAEVGLRQIAAAREDIRIVDSTAGPRQRRQNDGSGGTCYAERDRFAGKERFS